MTWARRSGTAALVVLLSVCMALAPVAAQQADIGVIHQRYNELYSVGNYAAALIEAQKYEAAVKEQFGTNHSNYAAALNTLANVYQRQGNYDEAEGLYKRARLPWRQADYQPAGVEFVGSSPSFAPGGAMREPNGQSACVGRHRHDRSVNGGTRGLASLTLPPHSAECAAARRH